MPATVYISPSTQPWTLASGDKPLYQKELIYTGRFRHGKTGPEFEVDELLLQHWVETFNRMRENGIGVPLPLKHTDDPEANRGEVVAMFVSTNNEGIPALFGQVLFRDDEAAKLAKTANVSIYSPPDFVDGKGNRYVRPVRHVALTDYPVIPKLQGFEAIAASFYNPEETEVTMPLLDLTKKLSIDCEAEDKAEAAIVAAFEERGTAIAKHDEIVAAKDEEIAGLKKRIPSDPIKVVASHRSMLKDNRTMKLDKLVGEKISPAVKDALLEIFCSDDQLNLVLSQENADDSFDKIVDALGKNEIVQLGTELSGQQGGGGTTLPKGKVAENPLLADVKKRQEAAS